MATTVQNSNTNTLVDLKDFLDGLRADGRINQQGYGEALIGRRSAEDRNKHVLHYLADLGLNDRKAEGRKQAYKEGMLSLRLSGAQKVATGLTTVNEILRVTPENKN